MPGKKQGLVFSRQTGFGRVRAWRFILVAAVAVAVALAAFSAPSPAQEKKAKGPSRPPSEVGVDAVITEPLSQTVPVIGRFVARQAGVVAARINGPIKKFLVEVGDRVDKGDVIAVLVDNTLKWRHELQKAEEKQYAAALRSGMARLKLRRQELQRIERLIKSAAFSHKSSLERSSSQSSLPR